MNTRLFLIALFAINICHGQTYQENLDRCAKNFQNGFKSDNVGKEAEKYFKDLRECIVGQTFPAFSAVTMGGKQFSEVDLKGKVVLINLWFIGCQPCIAEMPLLGELNSELNDKNFILLSFSRDDETSLAAFLKKNNIPYPVFGHANELIMNKFRMRFGYPTNLILDKNRKIIEFRVGGPVEEPGLTRAKQKLKSIIEEALKE